VDAVLAKGTARWNGIPYWTAEWSDRMAALQLNAVCLVTREHAHLGAVKYWWPASLCSFVAFSIVKWVSFRLTPAQWMVKSSGLERIYWVSCLREHHGEDKQFSYDEL
jgi:hypothetical protein